MYKKLSCKLTDTFTKWGIINSDQADIYRYGFELLISSLAYGLIFILISLLCRCLIASLFFFSGFYIIRKFCGGFHANSYFKCHLLFAINHLLVILALKLIPQNVYYFVTIGIFLFASFVILFFAPVDHKNKRFVKNEYLHFRKCSVIYAIILLVFFIITLTKILPAHKIVLGFALGTLSASISMLSAKIINFKERRVHNQ